MAEKARRWRQVWDLPLGPLPCVRLCFDAIIGLCRRCGREHTVMPEGIEPNAQATWRLREWVSGLCRELSATAAARLLGFISPATAWRWDKQVLEQTLPPPRLDGLRVLLIDEKSVGRGHDYVTLVLNADNGELLHMATGRKKEALEAFFARLSDAQRASIEAVCMDRLGSYHAVVRERLPHACIVFDKFHIIANYKAGVTDEVRRAEARKAGAEQKELFKGQRFNLLRNPENLSPEQRASLKDLMALNENLATVYVLGDALRSLWTYSRPADAIRCLERWVNWAYESGIAALEKFAKGILRDAVEIVSFCLYPISNGAMEAFNNLVARILHRCCGIRSLEYLWLKLRQESLAR
jgi:transposase